MRLVFLNRFEKIEKKTREASAFEAASIAMAIDECRCRVPGYMRSLEAPLLMALIHAQKCKTENSQGDEYASLYHRARKCGARSRV